MIERVSGLIHCGSGLGGAFTPVFIAWIVQRMGWRELFWLSGAITFGVAVLRWKPSTDHPAQHGRVNEAELQLITSLIWIFIDSSRQIEVVTCPVAAPR